MKKILYLFLVLPLIFSSCKKEEGCKDALATNYNADAEEDDGSCTYSLVGVWTTTSMIITGDGAMGPGPGEMISDISVEEYYFYSSGNFSSATVFLDNTSILAFGSYTASGSSLNITYATTDGQSGSVISTIAQINGNTMSFQAIDYPAVVYTTVKSFSKSNLDLPPWVNPL